MLVKLAPRDPRSEAVEGGEEMQLEFWRCTAHHQEATLVVLVSPTPTDGKFQEDKQD